MEAPDGSSDDKMESTLTDADSEKNRVQIGNFSANKSALALKRWKILSNAIRKHEIDVGQREFSTFGLMKMKKKIENANDNDGEWHEIYSPLLPDLILHIRFIKQKISPSDLIGFNNTGNVCVWPSEEVLAHYLLKRRSLFDGKSICEIGGGMTCLAGILIAAAGNSQDVLLTDGNILSVKNIQQIINANSMQFNSTKVKCRVLQWDVRSHLDDLESKFDYVICADCVFFKERREELAQAIMHLLKPKGEAFIFAPSRSNSLQEFELLIQKYAQVEMMKDYDDDVTKSKNKFKTDRPATYNEDIHYPILLHVTK